MFEVFALAIAGRRGAKTKRGELVADTGFEDAMIDLGYVARERAFIIEGVRGDVLGAKRAFVHGDKVRTDALVDVILSERAVFDKHVHLDAVTERFMRDEAGNLG